MGFKGFGVRGLQFEVSAVAYTPSGSGQTPNNEATFEGVRFELEKPLIRRAALGKLDAPPVSKEVLQNVSVFACHTRMATKMPHKKCTSAQHTEMVALQNPSTKLVSKSDVSNTQNYTHAAQHGSFLT